MKNLEKFQKNGVHEKGLLCAYLSGLAYLDITKIVNHLNNQGCHRVEVFKMKSLEYFTCYIDGELFVVFRGTDTEKFSEQIKDIYVSTRMYPSVQSNGVSSYKIHTGYMKSGEKIYKDIAHILHHHDGEITFCGHSLGGVLAKYIGIRSGTMCDIYTFGAPALATYNFYKNGKFKKIINYVNNKDMIPSFGSSLYDDYNDKIYKILEDGSIVFTKLTHNGIFKPLWRFIKNILTVKSRKELQDHSVNRYIKHIYTFVSRVKKTLTS